MYIQGVVAEALPEISDPRRISTIARKSYCEKFYRLLDLAFVAKNRERMAREIEIEGLESYKTACNVGKGVVVAGAHLGAWSIPVILMARHGYSAVPIVINPGLEAAPRMTRSLFEFTDSMVGEDGYILTGDDTISRARAILQEGKQIVITIDVGGGQIVELFGRAAAVASGVGHLACYTGSPVLTAFILRKKDPFKTRLVFSEPHDFNFCGEYERDVNTVIQEVARAIESQIRLAPEQWGRWGALGFWWKSAEVLKRHPRPLDERD